MLPVAPPKNAVGYRTFDEVIMASSTYNNISSDTADGEGYQEQRDEGTQQEYRESQQYESAPRQPLTHPHSPRQPLAYPQSPTRQSMAHPQSPTRPVNLDDFKNQKIFEFREALESEYQRKRVQAQKDIEEAERRKWQQLLEFQQALQGELEQTKKLTQHYMGPSRSSSSMEQHRMALITGAEPHHSMNHNFSTSPTRQQPPVEGAPTYNSQYSYQGQQYHHIQQDQYHHQQQDQYHHLQQQHLSPQHLQPQFPEAPQPHYSQQSLPQNPEFPKYQPPEYYQQQHMPQHAEYQHPQHLQYPTSPISPSRHYLPRASSYHPPSDSPLRQPIINQSPVPPLSPTNIYRSQSTSAYPSQSIEEIWRPSSPDWRSPARPLISDVHYSQESKATGNGDIWRPSSPHQYPKYLPSHNSIYDSQDPGRVEGRSGSNLRGQMQPYGTEQSYSTQVPANARSTTPTYRPPIPPSRATTPTRPASTTPTRTRPTTPALTSRGKMLQASWNTPSSPVATRGLGPSSQYSERPTEQVSSADALEKEYAKVTGKRDPHETALANVKKMQEERRKKLEALTARVVENRRRFAAEMRSADHPTEVSFERDEWHQNASVTPTAVTTKQTGNSRRTPLPREQQRVESMYMPHEKHSSLEHESKSRNDANNNDRAEFRNRDERQAIDSKDLYHDGVDEVSPEQSETSTGDEVGNGDIQGFVEGTAIERTPPDPSAVQPVVDKARSLSRGKPKPKDRKDKESANDFVEKLRRKRQEAKSRLTDNEISHTYSRQAVLDALEAGKVTLPTRDPKLARKNRKLQSQKLVEGRSSPRKSDDIKIATKRSKSSKKLEAQKMEETVPKNISMATEEAKLDPHKTASPGKKRAGKHRQKQEDERPGKSMLEKNMSGQTKERLQHGKSILLKKERSQKLVTRSMKINHKPGKRGQRERAIPRTATVSFISDLSESVRLGSEGINSNEKNAGVADADPDVEEGEASTSEEPASHSSEISQALRNFYLDDDGSDFGDDLDLDADVSHSNNMDSFAPSDEEKDFTKLDFSKNAGNASFRRSSKRSGRDNAKLKVRALETNSKAEGFEIEEGFDMTSMHSEMSARSEPKVADSKAYAEETMKKIETLKELEAKLDATDFNTLLPELFQFTDLHGWDMNKVVKLFVRFFPQLVKEKNTDAASVSSLMEGPLKVLQSDQSTGAATSTARQSAKTSDIKSSTSDIKSPTSKKNNVILLPPSLTASEKLHDVEQESRPSVFEEADKLEAMLNKPKKIRRPVSHPPPEDITHEILPAMKRTTAASSASSSVKGGWRSRVKNGSGTNKLLRGGDNNDAPINMGNVRSSLKSLSRRSRRHGGGSRGLALKSNI